jgi:hypothetical protein
MFQSVRPNSQIFILHKCDNPYVENGVVTTQPLIKPKYQIPATFGQPQEMVVDISVKVNEKNVTYTSLPAQLDISDSYSNGENIVVSDNKEAINSEVLSLKQKSIDIINSKDYHENLITCYDRILSDLNPELAEKKAQKEEIETLKNQMTDMSKNIEELMSANRLLIERLSIKTI